MNLITNLKSGIIICRNMLIQQSSDKIAEVIVAVTKSNKPVLVVDDSNEFFTVDNLLKFYQAEDKRYEIIFEKLTDDGMLINKQQFVHVQNVLADKQAVVIKKIPEIVSYDFAEVPEGWSISEDWSLGPTKFRRKRLNKYGHGGDISISPDEFKKLWDYASKFWVKDPYIINELSINSSIGDMTFLFLNDKLLAFKYCIFRFEIEQIAKRRGWDFPKAD